MIFWAVICLHCLPLKWVNIVIKSVNFSSEYKNLSLLMFMECLHSQISTMQRMRERIDWRIFFSFWSPYFWVRSYNIEQYSKHTLHYIDTEYLEFWLFDLTNILPMSHVGLRHFIFIHFPQYRKNSSSICPSL